MALALAAMLVQAQFNAASCAEMQAVRLEITRVNGTWTYKVVNGGVDSVSAVSLFLDAPYEVSGTPPGWAAETDNCSMVQWHSLDEQPPYRHDVAPSTSMSGFSIRSAAATAKFGQYVIQTWSLEKEAMDRAFRGQVSVPGSDETHCGHD